jgi:ferredoxin
MSISIYLLFKNKKEIMAIKKVWIEEGCTACGLCEDICPEVFKMEDIATVIEGVNYADYGETIKEAAESCPVEVIKYTE